MNLTESQRIAILQNVFPEDTLLAGPKNLRKIARNTDIKIDQTTGGSNMDFAAILALLVQASTFIETSVTVWKELSQKDKKEPNSQTVVNITINNTGVNTSHLNEEQLTKLVKEAILVVKSKEEE